MILLLSNGQQLRGDLLKSAVLRSDAVPVPATLELEVRADAENKKFFAEGQTLTAGHDQDVFRIIRTDPVNDRTVQGSRPVGAIRVTAILEDCHPVAFVKDRALLKEKATLHQIYRAAGASLRAVDVDFPVSRFYCPAGDVPTFHIARALQEEGGIVRWKGGRLKFFRLADLFRQKPVMTIPDHASENVSSGFLERHNVPFFYSTDEHGNFVLGNRTKARTARYVPHLDAQRLRNLTRVLVRRKVSKINFAGQIAAGDLIGIHGQAPLVVVTAAHVYESGTDGSGSNQYTRLWLATLEE